MPPSSCERARFGFELFVGGTLLAQRLDDETAELPPRRRELVGDVGRREAVAAGELGVRWTVAILAGEIVRLEDGESVEAAARGARVAQPGRGATEEAAQPLAMKVRVEVVDGVGRLESQLALGFPEIEAVLDTIATPPPRF
jgi:hypothetical protein